MSKIKTDESICMTGRLLIASPAMPKESIFSKSVIYIISHNINGAIGLIVNQAVGSVNCSSIFEGFKTVSENNPELVSYSNDTVAIYLGGPVESEKGFVLHTNDYDNDPLFKSENNGVAVSSNVEILKDIASGHGPSKSIFALGYAGWEMGQLEHEISNNNWLVAPFSNEVVFTGDNSSKWDLAMKSLGIKPYCLSLETGHA